MTEEAPGKILAIDYGEKRIGLAISDKQQTVAFPRETIINEGEEELTKIIQEYCEKEKVAEIALGLPLNEDHTEIRMTGVVEAFAKKLENMIEIPVHLVDEKFTTAEANIMMEEMGVEESERRKHKDTIAAMIILKEFMDSQ